MSDAPKPYRLDVVHVFLLTFIVIVQALFIGIVGFNVAKAGDKMELLMAAASREPMLNRSIHDQVLINGIYFEDDFYCVYTHGEDNETIISRDPLLRNIDMYAIHEYAHHLVYTDYGHFCEKKGWLDWIGGAGNE